MKCAVQFKTKEFLQDNNLIDSNNNVLNLEEFKKAARTLDNLAFSKYSVDTLDNSLFSLRNEADGIKVEYNENMFNILQNAEAEYYTESFQSLLEKYKQKVNSLRVNNNYVEGDLVSALEDIEFTEVTASTTLFNTERPSNANEAIKRILEEDLDGEVRELLEQIVRKFPELKTKIQYVSAKALLAKTNEPANVMVYDRINNVIYVSPELIKERGYSASYISNTFVHEVMHSVTLKALLDPTTIEQELFSEQVALEYTRLKEKASEELKNSKGFANKEEFVAEMFSNPDFRQEVNRLDKNFFDMLINLIRRIFGFKKNNVYNRLIKSGVRGFSQENINNENAPVYYLKTDENFKVDNTTFDKRLANTIKKINNSIDQNIKQIKGKLEYRKETNYNTEVLDEILLTLQAIENDIQTTIPLEQIKAINDFVKLIQRSLNTLNAGLARRDPENLEYTRNLIQNYTDIISYYEVIEEIKDIVVDLETSRPENISEEDIKKIAGATNYTLGLFYNVQGQLHSLIKEHMFDTLNDIKYHKEVENKHYQRLKQEHKDANLIGDREQWIIQMMSTRDKERIDEDVKIATEELIANPVFDISSFTLKFVSSVNVGSKFVQILEHMLNEIYTERNSEREKADQEFQDIFTEAVQTKGTNNIKKLYSNLYEQTADGTYYLKGEYSVKFLDEVIGKINTVREKYDEQIEELQLTYLGTDPDSDFYQAQNDKVRALVEKRNTEIKAIEDANYDYGAENEKIIKDKWKNDLSSLSEIDKKLLSFFTKSSEDIRKLSYSAPIMMSNIKYYGNGKFYTLPKISKSDTERLIVDKNAVGYVKDKFADRNVRVDDVGYVEEMSTVAGKKILQKKLWYRDPVGVFDSKNQSLDLMTIFRLDYINALNYNIRHQHEDKLNYLLEIASAKEKFYKKKGNLLVVNPKLEQAKVIDGEQSNTAALMKHMMETRFYDVMAKTGTTFLGMEAHKIVDMLNSTSALLTLSLNFASGTANVINANGQLFIESFAKGYHITAKDIAKANALYGNNLPEILKDTTRPVNRSLVNQIHEYFDTQGLRNMSNVNFIITDMLKLGMNKEALRVFQESGEHWIQSTVALSILNNIKVLNENSQFIDKDGKVVKSKDKAASVLDMMSVDKTTGALQISDKFTYTTHSKLTKWNEGGKENVTSLIHKKLDDIIGNYRQTHQPEVMKHWLGKLVLLYRKFLVPMAIYRGKGLNTVGIRKENLQEKDRPFNYALQEYDEGYYTTFFRYVLDSIKRRKFYLLSKGEVWKNLTDFEKHNIKKFVVETVMIYGMLPLLVEFAAASAKADTSQDDEEYLFFLIYQIRRLRTELAQYRSYNEAFKMLRSPIPSARLFETTLDIFTTSLNPTKWGEVYENGHNKGKNKIITKTMKQIPVAKEFYRTYKDLFEFQNSYFGNR